MAPKNVLKVHAVSRVTLQHGIRGGMEYYFDFVVRGLANLGHSITVVSTEMATQPKMDDVVTFHPLPVGVGSREGPWAHKLLQYFEGLTPPPDAIISNSFAAAHLTRLEKPLVPIIHGSGFVDLISAFRLWSVGHESLMIILKELARVAKNSFFDQRRLLNRSCRIVAVSQETKRSLSRIYGAPLDKIQVISSPVDTDQFRSAQIRTLEMPSAERPFRILSAGTLSRQKGFEFVIEAVGILNKTDPFCYQLTIAGKGPEMECLKQKSRGLEIDSQVSFVGEVGETTLADIYRQNDLFVLATLREEGFPLVISEALASGVPTITTRVGGNVTAVRDGIDGYLIKAGSAENLAVMIRSLAHDSALLARMASNARERALNELDSRVVVRSFERVLMEAVSSS